MSSVRLFVLAAFARHGEMHGHQLLRLAEQEEVQAWTDISVGSLYQVIKRMAAEGLVTQVRCEVHGRFPERRVFAITDTGEVELRRLQHQLLRTVHVRPDPFDLALSRPDPGRVNELPGVLQQRLQQLEALLETDAGHREARRAQMSAAEDWAFDHYLHRLEAEVAWLRRALGAVDDIVTDTRRRAGLAAAPARADNSPA